VAAGAQVFAYAPSGDGAELRAAGASWVFTDMAHYTMVKTTTFNGVPHPDIDTYDPVTDELRVIRRFGYEDFKRKLS
jgi:carboxynorspermidine decarboxylase